MSTWDEEIFSVDANTDFLDELDTLEGDELEQALIDAVLLAANQDPSTVNEDELLNAQAAATIVAIWSGAPFSAGETADTYTFIRTHNGALDEETAEAATSVLEAAAEHTDSDLDQFLEALA